MRKEKAFLESSINDLKTIILSLEEEVKEGKEREQLLVQFPERNPSLVPNPAKTGRKTYLCSMVTLCVQNVENNQEPGN